MLLLSTKDGLQSIARIYFFILLLCALVEDGIDVWIIDDAMMVPHKFNDALIDYILHQVGQLFS